MRDSERLAVMAEDGVQDLAHREWRPVDRSLGDGDDPANPVSGVADDDDDSLPAQAGELMERDGGCILRAPQHDWLVASPSRKPAEPEGRHERRRPRIADAAPPPKLLRSSPGEAVDPAELGEELGGESQHALAAPPGPEH